MLSTGAKTEVRGHGKELGGVLHYWALAKIEAVTFDLIQSHRSSHRSSMNIVEARPDSPFSRSDE